MLSVRARAFGNVSESFIVNLLSDDKILGFSELKPFADDKSDVPQNLNFVFGRVENIVGKGENAGFKRLLFRGC